MSKKNELPAIKEKDFMGEVTNLVKTMKTTLTVKPSEVEKIKIETEDDFSIADNSFKNVKDNLKLFDERRKEITKPLDTVKTKVKAMFDEAMVPLVESKAILTSKMTSFRQVQRQAAIAKEKREKEELETKASTRIEDMKRVNRIEHNLYVRLFGGDTIKINKEGEKIKEKKRPCSNTLDVQNNIDSIENSFPSIDKFPDHLREDIIRVKEMYLMVARKLKQAFFESESETASVREIALNTIMTLNSEYSYEVEQRRNERKEELDSKIKSVEKKIENNTDKEKKGFRKDIKFEILNQEAVPDRFKIVNDKKINEFKVQNREKMLKYIQEGKALEIVPGIKFYVDENYRG